MEKRYITAVETGGMFLVIDTETGQTINAFEWMIHAEDHAEWLNQLDMLEAA